MKITILIGILLVPFFVHAQSQGCLYNGTLYPTKNGTIIVGAFGSCPASTSVYSGAVTMPYVATAAQCSGNTSTAVLGSQYTGPGQTKCVIFFSPATYVCSDVYNFVACPLDDLCMPVISIFMLVGCCFILKKKNSADLIGGKPIS